MSRDDDDTTVRDAALLGGGAVLTYLLLRGLGGRGFGGGAGAGTGSAGSTAPASATSPATVPASNSPPPAVPLPTGEPCRVWILRGPEPDAAEFYRLNGAKTDLSTAVAACRVAGNAHVLVTGHARQGPFEGLLRALLLAGVTSFTGDDMVISTLERVHASLILQGRVVRPIWTQRKEV